MSRLATKILLLGGLAALAAAGAAGASPASSDVPARVVRYNADMLATDCGAHTVYRQIMRAAEQVCPNDYSPLISQRALACREQAVAGAVNKIHNERLAAVYASSSKSG
jgi:UrcA family protein